MLLAVAKDANSQLVILAHAVVEGETAASWSWFLHLLNADFPGVDVILSDKAKGLQSCTTHLPAARCVRHMVHNLRLAVPQVRQKHVSCVYGLARAATADSFEWWLNHLRGEVRNLYPLSRASCANRRVVRSAPFVQVGGDGGNTAVGWLRRCAEEYSTAHFLALTPPRPRYGDITSNSAEQMNSAVKYERGAPIIDLLVQLGSRTRGWFFERHMFARSLEQNGRLIVPHIEKRMRTYIEKCNYKWIVLC